MQQNPLYLQMDWLIISTEDQQNKLDLLSKDIKMIQDRVNRVSQNMVNEIHDLQGLIDKRNMITESVFSIQNEKLECCMKYDDLSTIRHTNLVGKTETLNEILEKMKRLSDSLEEAVVTLEEAKKCVDDHINGN